MGIKGKLETLCLTSILQLLDNEQKTGVLRVSNGVNEVKIFLKDGTIIHATSSQKKFKLGNLLRRLGVLSKEELMRCLQSAREKNKKLGSVLVEKGHLSIDELKAALHYQAKKILYSLFFWETGEFEYEDTPLSVERRLITQMNTMDIVLKATCLIDEWSVITKLIPNDHLIFKITGKNHGSKKFTENERRILSLINGRRTLRELINEGGYSDFAAFKIVHTLMLLGRVEIIDRPWEGSETTIIEDKFISLKQKINDTNLRTEIKDIEQVVRKSRKRLSSLVHEDNLTGLYNRHYFDKKAHEEFAQAQHAQTPLSVLFIDLDHFKTVNDTYGHKTGDKVLRTIAKLVRSSCRKSDIIARYGGEEIVVVLPSTASHDAVKVASDIRKIIANQTIRAVGFRVTVSVGIATFPAHGNTLEMLLHNADGALYRAKREGRNCVRTYNAERD